MPNLSSAGSLSDPAMLLAAQAGDREAQSEMFGRFKALVAKMIRRARPDEHHDFVDDVVSETFRMLLAPKAKFQFVRGNSKQYIFGRVRNAIRTIERQRRPICVNLISKPVADDVHVVAQDAQLVHANTVGIRSIPAADTDFEDREAVAVAMNGEPDLYIAIAYLRFVEEIPITVIAAHFELDRFSVSRRLKRLCGAACKRLEQAGAV